MAIPSRSVRYWLLFTTFLIAIMVGVGGVTRLTRSGLSIVEWKPIAGVVPPLNEEQWNAEFEKYKAYPEYQKINHQMDLDEFKGIYFWEYIHRLLGRVIGLVFAIPLVFFALRRQIRLNLGIKLVIALFLGGLQGFIGWYMVQSGLIDNPHVSHYRLATHLCLALFLMGFLYWLAQDLRFPRRRHPSLATVEQRLRRWTLAFAGLLCVQIFYGAMVAGLRAGLIYNTFPLMNGLVVPPGMTALEGGWLVNLFENPVTTQFVHRSLGWIVFFSGLGLAYAGWKVPTISMRQRLSLWALGVMVIIQFLLGVFTLLNRVPVALGSLHQLGAAVLLLLTLNAVHSFYEQGKTFVAHRN